MSVIAIFATAKRPRSRRSTSAVRLMDWPRGFAAFAQSPWADKTPLPFPVHSCQVIALFPLMCPITSDTACVGGIAIIMCT